MNTSVMAPPCWSTASLGHSTATSTLELSALEEHLKLCRRACGRLFALQCLLEAFDRFVAARFITTLMTVTLMITMSVLVR